MVPRSIIFRINQFLVACMRSISGFVCMSSLIARCMRLIATGLVPFSSYQKCELALSQLMIFGKSAEIVSCGWIWDLCQVWE